MWTASGVMMLCSWLSYVDRQMLAVLSPTILNDTGMSVATYTTVVAWFSYAYMFANPLWGEFSTARFVGFPDATNPYARPSPNAEPDALLVLTAVEPRTDEFASVASIGGAR